MGALLCALLSVFFTAFLLTNSHAVAQTDLRLGFGPNGLNSLVDLNVELLSNGSPLLRKAVLISPAGIPQEADLRFQQEVDRSRQLVTQTYRWGRLTYQYREDADRIMLLVTVQNTSTQTIDSLAIHLLSLRFPVAPPEYDGSTPVVGYNIGSPTLLKLTYGSRVLFTMNEDVRQALLLGFPNAEDGPKNQTFPLLLFTGSNPLSDRPSRIERSLLPGEKMEFSISLRTASSATAVSTPGKDVLQRFAGEYPTRFSWSDRRPIASLFLSSANSGFPDNPRGWFLDPKVNINTVAGRAAFQERVLKWADDSIAILTDMGAQGAVVWDIEGEQYAHPVTYIGDPRQIGALAPEMDEVADRFFQRFRDAGLRVGMCVRAQSLQLSAEGVPTQQSADNIAELLSSKIAYAKQRWGASLFYIDSNGDSSLPVDASVIQQVAEAHPDVLLIPEHKNFQYYAITAPYHELRTGTAATPSLVRATYPLGFGVINTADGNVEGRQEELSAAVSHGDILMFRGWYDDAPNHMIADLYRRAPDLVPPTAIFYPLDKPGELSGSTTVRIWASDNRGVRQMKLEIDGVEKGVEFTGSPYLFVIDANSLTIGKHTLKATAMDFSGNTATAEEVVIVRH